MNAEQLPDYERPPLIETVLGVQFAKIAGFSAAHAGAFWESLGGETWTDAADATQIPPQFERFNSGDHWAKAIRLQLTQDPSCRVQIKNNARDRMLQIQNARFHVNWLGEGADYPRFGRVKEDFLGHFRSFEAFLKERGLPPIELNQWEVTYVNKIQRGTVWQDVSDWSFCKLMSGADGGGQSLESFAGEWHFLLPEEQGRLHVNWQHGRDDPEDDDPDFVRLTLTARGPVSGTIEEAIDSIEDRGRKAIVTKFRQIMTDQANTYWGLK